MEDNIKKLHERLQALLKKFDDELSAKPPPMLGHQTYLQGKIMGLELAIEQVQALMPDLE
jgi:hypothetical protein